MGNRRHFLSSFQACSALEKPDIPARLAKFRYPGTDSVMCQPTDCQVFEERLSIVPSGVHTGFSIQQSLGEVKMKKTTIYIVSLAIVILSLNVFSAPRGSGPLKHCIDVEEIPDNLGVCSDDENMYEFTNECSDSVFVHFDINQEERGIIVRANRSYESCERSPSKWCADEVLGGNCR